MERLYVMAIPPFPDKEVRTCQGLGEVSAIGPGGEPHRKKQLCGREQAVFHRETKRSCGLICRGRDPAQIWTTE